MRFELHPERLLEFGSGVVLPSRHHLAESRASFALDPMRLNPCSRGAKPFHTLKPQAMARLD